jgi:hypothetical protein
MEGEVTIKAWIRYERKCAKWSVDVGPALGEWLGAQSVGIRLVPFAGDEEEIEFVMRHMEGEFT